MSPAKIPQMNREMFTVDRTGGTVLSRRATRRHVGDMRSTIRHTQPALHCDARTSFRFQKSEENPCPKRDQPRRRLSTWGKMRSIGENPPLSPSLNISLARKYGGYPRHESFECLLRG